MDVKLESLSPNLMVEDMQKSLDFYCEILGFTKIMAVPEEGVPVWAMLQRDGISFMLQSRASIAEELPDFAQMNAGGSLLFYFKIKGVDDFYQSVHAAGASIYKEPNVTFYGSTEFAIKDPDGFVLVFAEDK